MGRSQAKKKRWESWWRRFWMSILMIGAFFAWLFLTRQSGIVLLVLVTQANIYRELVGLAIRENKERELPGFSAFYFYWFFVAVFFIYGRTLMVHLRVRGSRATCLGASPASHMWWLSLRSTTTGGMPLTSCSTTMAS